MDRTIKAAWVWALRGPFYAEGRDRLRTRDNRYCPFGVLCHLLHPDRWVRCGHHGYDDPVEGICWVIPPPSILLEAGISRAQEDDLTERIADGRTFAEIADYIERHL